MIIFFKENIWNVEIVIKILNKKVEGWVLLEMLGGLEKINLLLMLCVFMFCFV